MEKLVTSLAIGVIRHSGLIATVGTLLAAVGLYFSARLYMNLRTDFEELLPTEARAVVDLKEVRARLESIDSLGVLLFSEDTEKSRKFVDDLAARLRTAPKDVIASVEYRIDQELTYFKERQALFMTPDDLRTIQRYVEKRLEYERELYNPLNIFKEEELHEPRLNAEEIRQKYQSKVAGYERFPGGYYATPDEKKRVVLVYVPGNSSGVEKNTKLKALVEAAVHDLNPKSYAPDLEVKYTGGVQDALEENAALIADLELSTIVVAILVCVAMGVFYRNLFGTLALNASLFGGVFWTFGVSYFVEGYLNANSAFLGSIVIGNGINFGIIAMARMLEERRRGLGRARAMVRAMTATASATWTAALAAGLSYGSLALTSFRGFKQFGVIGLIGMVLCWISAYTLLPAYFLALERVFPRAFARGIRPLKPPSRWNPMVLVTAFIARFSRAIALATVLLTVASGVLLATRLDASILETNLSKLRNKDSMDHGSAFLSKHLDEIFQHYLSPMVVLPKTLEETRLIAAKLRSKRELEGPSSQLAAISTMEDFVPLEQEKKIELLAKIRRLLPHYLVQRLGSKEQSQIAEFLANSTHTPITKETLPELVRAKFREKDGSIGKLVLVEPPLHNELAIGERLIAFIKSIREVADSVRPGTAVAGTLSVTADMIEAVSRDGPRATLFAFCAVIVLVAVLFRDFKNTSLTLFSLVLGIVWLGGVMMAFGLKINFLNFIALPITFGIGVDYGVNIFQRYREEAELGTADILKVVRNTGGAVVLCSFSTMSGYASLLIARNQGFVSFGSLAVAGEVTCLTAALISLPAILTVLGRAAANRKSL